MPLVDSNDPTLWDGGATSLYRCWVNNQAVGYSRTFLQTNPGLIKDIDLLIAVLVSKGLTQGQRIVLVGAGFGWTAERLIELGYGPIADGTANGKVLAVDTSTWIQANKGNGNATLPILNADVNAATGRRTIRQQFGSNTATVDWVVSDDVLSLLTGVGSVPGGVNEIVPFCQNMRSLATNVAHSTSVGIRRFDDPNTWAGDPRLNWKTLEEWKAWVTPDWVIARSGGAVL